MPDPLAGKRTLVATGKLAALTYPANRPCPVQPGDRFRLRGGITIEITEVTRKRTLDGPQWVARFDRHLPDRKYLLRSAPNAPTRTDPAGDPTTDEIKRAAITSHYTTTTYDALPNEPEAIDPELVDQLTVERIVEAEKRKQAADREWNSLTVREKLRRIADLENLPDTAGEEIRRIEKQLDRVHAKTVRRTVQ